MWLALNARFARASRFILLALQAQKKGKRERKRKKPTTLQAYLAPKLGTRKCAVHDLS